jgi:cell division septation protein DedD
VDKQVDLGFHEALKDPKTELTATALSLPDPAVLKEPENSDVLPEKTESNLPKKAKPPEFQKNTKTEIPAPWVIQVAATQDEAYGNQLAENLKKMGFRAYLTAAEVSGKGTWYRIRVGGYTGRSEAEADYERLKKERFSPMIITP